MGRCEDTCTGTCSAVVRGEGELWCPGWRLPFACTSGVLANCTLRGLLGKPLPSEAGKQQVSNGLANVMMICMVVQPCKTGAKHLRTGTMQLIGMCAEKLCSAVTRLKSTVCEPTSLPGLVSVAAVSGGEVGGLEIIEVRATALTHPPPAAPACSQG